MENGRFAFLSPSLRAWATYDDHLGLIGKCVHCVVDFLLVLVELFSLGATAEALRANRLKIDDFAPAETGWPKISGRRVASHQLYSSSQNTRLNDLSYSIKSGQVFFRFVTIHAFDGRTNRSTDRQTDNLLLTRPPCIQCSAVKTSSPRAVNLSWQRSYISSFDL